MGCFLSSFMNCDGRFKIFLTHLTVKIKPVSIGVAGMETANFQHVLKAYPGRSALKNYASVSLFLVFAATVSASSFE